MPDLLLYVIKLNVVLVLFYLAYRLVLRHLTFFTPNRFFLLFGLIFGALCPLLEVSAWWQRPAPTGSQGWEIVVLPAWEAVRPAAETQASFDPWPVVLLVFGAGAGVMGLRLLLRLLSLYRMHRLSRPATIGGHRCRIIGEPLNPFSFGRAIYLNPRQHQPGELQAILQHEQVHVREGHTVDVLLAEVALLFAWFNPAAWLLQRAIRENLEFIADHQVLQTGLDTKSYQYSLVRISGLAPSPILGTHFTFLTLKKRIAMMNKTSSSALQALKYALIVPLVLIFALTLTVSANPAAPLPTSAAAPTPAVAAEPVYYIDAKEAPKGSMEALDPNDIDNVQVLKGEKATAVFGAKGQNGVVVITTKKNREAEGVRALNEKINRASEGTGGTGQVPTDGATVTIRQKDQTGAGGQGAS